MRSMLLLSCLIGSGVASAAEHIIPPTVSSFDCSAVAPGDTVTFQEGRYELSPAFMLRDCEGSPEQPIFIRAAGQVEFVKVSSNTDNFVWHFRNVRHVVVDGEPGKFLVTVSSGRSPSAYVAFTGTSSDFTIRNVEIDGRLATGGAGIGLSVNDSNENDPCQPERVCLWRQNITIERLRVHSLRDTGECLYVGPNWSSVAESADDWRLRNITIRHNEVEDCGRDGIQLKSAIEGINKVYGNTVRGTGRGSNDSRPEGQRHGISIYEGCADVFDNVIEDAGERGIEFYSHTLPTKYGPCEASVANNLVLGAGVTGPLPGVGIQVGRHSVAVADFALVVEGNLVKRVASDAININGHVAESGLIESNVVCDSGLVEAGAYAISNTIESCRMPSAPPSLVDVK